MAGYAHPEVLVETDWVHAHLGQPGCKFVEIDVDTKSYDVGHVPGAVGFNWETQLQDQVRRDVISQQSFERLIGGAGISPSDTVVLYGDHNNWFAAHGFWLFKIYGHRDVRLMNGGRVKWLNEADKPLVTQPTEVKPVPYKVAEVHWELRARVADVLTASSSGEPCLVDVRSPEEFSGKVIAPPGMHETAQRGGHIPGAKSIPWYLTLQTDGSFKPMEQLRAIYFDEKGVDPQKGCITYCRIGERSSHSWFVLKYLLGLQQVTNYDGSWTEYGNLVGVPIDVAL
jgi:thiosulfate/3-mercaptopyruvate sulfurtransferase